MPLANRLGQPLDRLADHSDLVGHGGLRLEVAEESLLRHTNEHFPTHGTGWSSAMGGSVCAGRVLGGVLALLQVQSVLGEHLLRADLAWQDLLLLSEPDHGLHRFTVATQAVGERVIPH